jgi:UDPglucose 6-dehydrogenase
MSNKRASVVGLGKLGVCLAATLAVDALPVVGVDIDERTVNQIQEGSAPLREPHLQEYIDQAGENLDSTTDIEAAVDRTDITFVVVNTPSTSAGRYSLEYVEEVCRAIGRVLSSSSEYHVVVISSTVIPGSTTGEIKRWLEESSGRSVGADLGLCYSPEFIAIGDVIRGLEDPDFFLVGEADERAGDVLVDLYGRLGTEDTPVARMDPTTAEVTKMAVNSYVTMKISFANSLAQISEGVKADVDAITSTLAMDSRISGDYLNAGAKYGGPCFPRDNVAFTKLAEDAETRAPLALATDDVNRKHTEWITDVVTHHTPPRGSVAVLGMTYKPGTYLVTESLGLALTRSLSDDFDVYVHDPMGNDQARASASDTTVVADPHEAIEAADTAVITTRWDEYEDPSLFTDHSLTVVDPWAVFEADEVPESVRYHALGRPQLSTTSVDAPTSTPRTGHQE